MSNDKMMRKNNSSLPCIALLVLLGACSGWAIYKSIFYGCDIDESYAVTLSTRLVLGDHLFKEMWEVHQTSAVFMAPFIYAYRLLHGSMTGIIVYLRVVGTAIQTVIAAFFYNSLTKHTERRYACFLTLLFFHFSPKYSQVLEFCFLEYLFMICMVIAFFFFLKDKKIRYMALAGIFQAFSVFAYPQMLLLLPIELALLWAALRGEEKKRAYLLGFFAAEAVTGGLYFLYILRHVTLQELWENIPYILSDESHQLNLAEKLIDHGSEALYYLIRLLVGVLLFELLWKWLKKHGKQEKRFTLECGFLTAGLLYALVPILMKYYTGVRHLDLSYPILFVSGVLGYMNIRFPKKDDINRVLRFLSLMLFLMYLCSCFASNMTMYANGGLLVPAMLVLWLQFLRNHGLAGEAVRRPELQRARVFWIPAALLMFYFLSARMALIRFTAVQPKTIFDTYVRIEDGAARHIKVTEKEHEIYYAAFEAVERYVTEDDSLLFFGSDTYSWIFTGCGISAPTTISTPMYTETMMEYYRKYPYKEPTVILVDKYWQGPEELLAVPEFGDWVIEQFDFDHIVKDRLTIVIYRREK